MREIDYQYGRGPVHEIGGSYCGRKQYFSEEEMTALCSAIDALEKFPNETILRIPSSEERIIGALRALIGRG